MAVRFCWRASSASSRRDARSSASRASEQSSDRSLQLTLHVQCCSVVARAFAPEKYRPRDCPSGSRLRWSPAVPSRSSRPPARDCPTGRVPGLFAFCCGVRRKSRPPLAHDLPRRHLVAQSRQSAATSRPDRGGKLLARRIEQTVCRADGHGQAVGSANSHSTVPLTTPMIGGTDAAARRS